MRLPFGLYQRTRFLHENYTIFFSIKERAENDQKKFLSSRDNQGKFFSSRLSSRDDQGKFFSLRMSPRGDQGKFFSTSKIPRNDQGKFFSSRMS